MNLPPRANPLSASRSSGGRPPTGDAVSIVIPARDEAASIRALLRSLANQTAAPAEIIVVDGGSTDATPGEVRAVAATDRRIRLIEAGPATPGRGRNVGIAAARHPRVALIDAGAWADPRWLEELLAAAARHPESAVVYGNYEPVADTFFTRCAAAAYVPPKRDTPDGLMRGPSTISMLLTREAWTLVDEFPDLRAGEDLIFMERLARRRVPAAYAPAATVWWRLQPSLAATFRRAMTYSRHNVLAGLQARWHHRLLRLYVVGAALVGLAIAHDARWLLALPAGLVLRAAVAVWRRRGPRGAPRPVWHPAQLAGVLAILLALDAATFAGWAWAIAGKSGLAAPRRPVRAHRI